jgi:hypothetical protein
MEHPEVGKQELERPLKDMSQIAGGKTGSKAQKVASVEPIRLGPPSDGRYRKTAFGVHH